MKKSLFTSILLVVIGCNVVHPVMAESSFDTQYAVDWSSRYVIEGRDALDGDSLSSAFFGVSRDNFFGEVWYGHSPGADYGELDFFVGMTGTVGVTDAYLSYAFKNYDTKDDDFEDSEIGVGVAWSDLPAGLALSVDGYHSFDAEGSFWEAAVSRDLDVHDGLALSGSGILGMNQGYIADGHDGLNHLSLRIDIEHVISELFSVAAYAAYIWEIDSNVNTDPGDELLIDFFHAGVSIQWYFP